ncbi:Zinc finger protein rotund-like Protein [Tribolium castaneum]|uniref:Zinc finger protein rotund-like Protein n=1 Tax=Tribolium castaneum TaxID=7070 RepID=A0A139W8M7_TRICA|nr:Zinc finger protein rotund-like Protein [Tribolium castaneum]
MYPWYRDSVGGQLGQLCGPMATTIKTENGYNDCMLALDYATQSKKAFGWDGAQSGGSPSGPQSGGVGGQGAQGLVHWMSVMAEHMDPAMSHYMSWNQECGQHAKDDYPNWTRNTMGINKQGYEAKMNEHNQMHQKNLDDHHMGGTPGLYTSGRSTSSSSSPGVAGSSPALLVVPQPINATKMGGMQNGGPQPRKYQCKMCPQYSFCYHSERSFFSFFFAVIVIYFFTERVTSACNNRKKVKKKWSMDGRLEYRTGGLDFHQPSPMLLDNHQNYSSHLQRSIDTLRSLGDRLGERPMDLNLSLMQERMNLDLNHLQERPLMDRNNLERGYERLREPQVDMRHEDLKYREYKAHLENLRSESSRSMEGRTDEDRGTTPSTPPTPISVGENFQEEKVFGSKAELQLHTQAHMREAKPYKCSQCCKAFANSSYLSQHTRIHLGIKPYRCEICQRKFTQLSHLQQHIRTHTGDKPYKCRHPGCQKAFSQLSNLQSHSRCHQTDKPYKCNSCYKCFSDEPSLLEHIPKHKESKHLKTHICQYCGKSYTQETYLSKHMQKHAERTDKRPPIGPALGLNHRGLEHPYWPKVSPDSAENMHEYPSDIPRQILEQNEDLVIIRQQLQNPPAPPGTPTANLSNSYDASISKSTTNSAFTPINSMSGHLNLNHHQLAPNRPYIYDAISFQKQNSLDLPKSQPSNGFPNQLISLHQIRNYAHQPNAGLMEHSILGGLKDK